MPSRPELRTRAYSVTCRSITRESTPFARSRGAPPGQSFSLHPGGRWLFVANQASNTVNLFSVDPWSGQLTDTGASVPVPKPDCITFSRR
ncbi:lactonase family protein [Streptomyces sp. NBC_01450]|uniref:beta-propeller fold lactonase family protein n=1 Tax=Streptomyces sp. NBC_01450 TaxID=2903871 RepID=UPI002E334CFA|nr:beta-propeller fold lactonase family protein [Streptomyces sp. NBC_01450]